MAKMGELKMPYLYGEPQKAYETPMEWENHWNAPEMESQWKRPWMYESYPKMEWELAHPGQPSYPQPPGGTTYVDCTPKGDAVGGGSAAPCYSGINCGKWAFTCAHRITLFGVPQSFGWIQNLQQNNNDTVVVTVCWDEAARAAKSRLGITATGPNGWTYTSLVDMQNCCPDKEVCGATCNRCPSLSIGYTSQQMSCSSTQILTAGGGAGKYEWSVSGGGTVSPSKGGSTIFTASSSNEDCLSNPTITLKDCCGIKATVKLAVNCDADAGPASIHVWYYAEWEGIYAQYYNCAGTAGASAACCGGDNYPAQCDPLCCCGSSDCTIYAPCKDAVLGCDCSTRYVDVRTTEMKTAGCCPKQLLVGYPA